MKKTITTLTLILGLAIGATAQPSGGGLFQRGEQSESSYRGGNGSPMLPTHGHSDDQDAPLGGGIALMFCFGVLYILNRNLKGLKEE